MLQAEFGALAVAHGRKKKKIQVELWAKVICLFPRPKAGLDVDRVGNCRVVGTANSASTG